MRLTLALAALLLTAVACTSSADDLPVAPNVRVSLTPSRAEPGDEVALRITPPPVDRTEQARGIQLLYGVETWLQTEIAGNWHTIRRAAASIQGDTAAAFFAPDEEPIFPAIGFSGARVERYVIPNVPAGVYRIAKPITRSDGHGKNEDLFVAANVIIG